MRTIIRIVNTLFYSYTDHMASQTIDELSQATGIPSSTIRLYRHRGLIDPPVKQGRRAFYDDRHMDQLELIANLKERGYSLAAIQEIVELKRRGRTVSMLMNLPSEDTLQLSDAQIVELLFPSGEADPQVLQRALSLGLAHFGEDGLSIPDGRNLRVGAQLVQLGVPPAVVLDEYEALRTVTDTLARRFADLFEEHILPRADSPATVYEELRELATSIVELALLDSLHREGTRRIAD